MEFRRDGVHWEHNGWKWSACWDGFLIAFRDGDEFVDKGARGLNVEIWQPAWWPGNWYWFFLSWMEKIGLLKPHSA